MRGCSVTRCPRITVVSPSIAARQCVPLSDARERERRGRILPGLGDVNNIWAHCQNQTGDKQDPTAPTGPAFKMRGIDARPTGAPAPLSKRQGGERRAPTELAFAMRRAIARSTSARNGSRASQKNFFCTQCTHFKRSNGYLGLETDCTKFAAPHKFSTPISLIGALAESPTY